MPEKKKLYALLVGIDKYFAPVPALEGCVNDMLAMKEFLQQRTDTDGFELKEKVLQNDQATRHNIVQALEQHLGQAGENDIAFFYYSGHGSQEPAHEAFWGIEPDKKNETIVCYDSRTADGLDLADKEIATLLKLVAAKSPHILVVMDCCHSGSGTRTINEECVARKSDAFEYTRSLDSYILPKDGVNSRGALEARVQRLISPQSKHIQLAGAQSFELAKETRLGGTRRGVFTFSLLEVLNTTKGSLSYSDVMRRTRNLVTQRTYDQIPQLYASEAIDADQSFLGGAIGSKPDTFILSYDRDKGWNIDGGGVHGIIGPATNGATTELAVFPEDISVDEMENASRSLGIVKISKVNPSNSVVNIGSLNLDRLKVYNTIVNKLPIAPLKINLKGESSGLDFIRSAYEKSSYKDFIELSTEGNGAAYNLTALADLKLGGAAQAGYIINRPTDRETQPLVEQLVGFNEASAGKAVEYLNHIARWTRILEINNPSSRLPNEAVRVELYDTNENQIKPTSGGFAFSYKESGGQNAKPQFKIKLVNTHTKKLYCAVLYMSSQFGINTQLFSEGGVWLEPKGVAWALNGQAISGSVADELASFGKNEVIETFKVIASTEKYDTDELKQVELKLPKPQGTRGTDAGSRGLAFGASGDKMPDWNATEVPIRIRRED